MFLISELGTLIKTITAPLGYILFLPVHLLDKFLANSIFNGSVSTEGLALVVSLFTILLTLGFILRSISWLIKIGVGLMLVYFLSNFIVGVLFLVVIIYFMKPIFSRRVSFFRMRIEDKNNK